MRSARIESETAEGYRLIGGCAGAGIVLLCDHASNALPDAYGTLGLAPSELRRHIAYDIGAAAITGRLAAALDAPAVLTQVSRLLIDANRGEDDPTLIMRLSDGAVVPANADYTAADQQVRINRFYRPYHDRITRLLNTCVAHGPPPVIVSVHSMTDSWKGIPRPWHAAILSCQDRRVADPLLAGFRAETRLVIGDNEPYRGGMEGDTLWQHARPRGLRSTLIEYRQDLVSDTAGQEQWATLTATLLAHYIKQNPQGTHT